MSITKKAIQHDKDICTMIKYLNLIKFNTQEDKMNAIEELRSEVNEFALEFTFTTRRLNFYNALLNYISSI